MVRENVWLLVVVRRDGAGPGGWSWMKPPVGNMLGAPPRTSATRGGGGVADGHRPHSQHTQDAHTLTRTLTHARTHTDGCWHSRSLVHNAARARGTARKKLAFCVSKRGRPDPLPARLRFWCSRRRENRTRRGHDAADRPSGLVCLAPAACFESRRFRCPRALEASGCRSGGFFGC